MLADMEAGFQGALDNYAYAAEGGLIPDPQEQLATLAGLGGSTFQGVEPMGEWLKTILEVSNYNIYLMNWAGQI